jgi:hypothetical protein
MMSELPLHIMMLFACADVPDNAFGMDPALMHLQAGVPGIGDQGGMAIHAAPMLSVQQASTFNERVRNLHPEGFAYMPMTETGSLPQGALGQPLGRAGSAQGQGPPPTTAEVPVASPISQRPKRAAAQAARQRNFGNDEFEFMDD